MNNWRLLLFAVFCIFQPISSEENLIHGRERCCVHPDSTRKDTRQILEHRLTASSVEYRHINKGEKHTSKDITRNIDEYHFGNRQSVLKNERNEYSPSLIRDGRNTNRQIRHNNRLESRQNVNLESIKEIRTEDRLSFLRNGDRRSFTRNDKRSFIRNDNKLSFERNDNRRSFTNGNDERSFTKNGDRLSITRHNDDLTFTRNGDKRSFIRNDVRRSFSRNDEGSSILSSNDRRSFTRDDDRRVSSRREDRRVFSRNDDGRSFLRNNDRTSFSRHNNRDLPQRDIREKRFTANLARNRFLTRSPDYTRNQIHERNILREVNAETIHRSTRKIDERQIENIRVREERNNERVYRNVNGILRQTERDIQINRQRDYRGNNEHYDYNRSYGSKVLTQRIAEPLIPTHKRLSRSNERRNTRVHEDGQTTNKDRQERDIIKARDDVHTERNGIRGNYVKRTTIELYRQNNNIRRIRDAPRMHLENGHEDLQSNRRNMGRYMKDQIRENVEESDRNTRERFLSRQSRFSIRAAQQDKLSRDDIGMSLINNDRPRREIRMKDNMKLYDHDRTARYDIERRHRGINTIRNERRIKYERRESFENSLRGFNRQQTKSNIDDSRRHMERGNNERLRVATNNNRRNNRQNIEQNRDVIRIERYQTRDVIKGVRVEERDFRTNNFFVKSSSTVTSGWFELKNVLYLINALYLFALFMKLSNKKEGFEKQTRYTIWNKSLLKVD